jgi:hypothetical protein
MKVAQVGSFILGGTVAWTFCLTSSPRFGQRGVDRVVVLLAVVVMSLGLEAMHPQITAVNS